MEMKKEKQLGDINGQAAAVEIIQNRFVVDRLDFLIKISTYPSFPKVDLKALSDELNQVAQRMAVQRGVNYICYVRFIPYTGAEIVYKYEGRRNQ